MNYNKPPKITQLTLRAFYCIFFLISILVFSGCKKELVSKALESDLRFNPFGQGISVLKAYSLSDQSILTILDYSSMVKSSGEALTQEWRTTFDNYLMDATPCQNGEILAIESNYNFGYAYLTIDRLNSNGSFMFKTPTYQKLIPQYQDLDEQIIGICTDGNNGMYILALLSDYYGANIKRFLVHFNNQNSIDQRIELTDFFSYIQSDNQGGLYLTRTIGPSGKPMQLETIKLDVAYLKSNNALKELWTFHFTSLEPDNGFAWYFPFKFVSHGNHFYIIKQHLTGHNDEATGIDYIKLNATNGSLVNETSFLFNTTINNYTDLVSIYLLFNDKGHNIVFNYGKKSALVELEENGHVRMWHDLNGNANRCKTSAIAQLGSKKVVFGYSTLLKSPSYIPFVFLFKN